MEAILRKLTNLAKAMEQKNAAIDKDTKELAVKKVELETKEAGLDALEGDLKNREKKVEALEDVAQVKADLDARENAMSLKEQEVDKDIAKRIAKAVKREAAVVEKESKVNAQQTDLIDQKNKLQEERRTYKRKVLKEIEKDI